MEDDASTGSTGSIRKYTLTVTNGEVEKTSGHSDRKRKTDDSWYYLGVVGQMGFTIAVPIVIGALVGDVIGKVFMLGTNATAIGLGVGAAISFIGFIKMVRELLNRKV